MRKSRKIALTAAGLTMAAAAILSQTAGAMPPPYGDRGGPEYEAPPLPKSDMWYKLRVNLDYLKLLELNDGTNSNGELRGTFKITGSDGTSKHRTFGYVLRANLQADVNVQLIENKYGKHIWWVGQRDYLNTEGIENIKRRNPEAQFNLYYKWMPTDSAYSERNKRKEDRKLVVEDHAEVLHKGKLHFTPKSPAYPDTRIRLCEGHSPKRALKNKKPVCKYNNYADIWVQANAGTSAISWNIMEYDDGAIFNHDDVACEAVTHTPFKLTTLNYHLKERIPLKFGGDSGSMTSREDGVCLLSASAQVLAKHRGGPGD